MIVLEQTWRQTFVKALAERNAKGIHAAMKADPDNFAPKIDLTSDECIQIATAWLKGQLLGNMDAQVARLARALPDSLYTVCHSGDPELLKALLAHVHPGTVADALDKRNRSPVFYAAVNDDHQVAFEMTTVFADYFKQHGCPELFAKTMNRCDADSTKRHPNTGVMMTFPGKPVLHRLCGTGNLEVIQLLMKSGAKMSNSDSFNHPMVYACKNEDNLKTDAQIINILGLFLGRDGVTGFDLMDDRGDTAIHTACFQFARGKIGADVLIYLLQNGALNNLLVADRFGYKPMFYLERKGKLNKFEGELFNKDRALYVEYRLLMKKDMSRFNEELAGWASTDALDLMNFPDVPKFVRGLHAVIKQQGHAKSEPRVRLKLLSALRDVMMRHQTFDVCDNTAFVSHVFRTIYAQESYLFNKKNPRPLLQTQWQPKERTTLDDKAAKYKTMAMLSLVAPADPTLTPMINQTFGYLHHLSQGGDPLLDPPCSHASQLPKPGQLEHSAGKAMVLLANYRLFTSATRHPLHTLREAEGLVTLLNKHQQSSSWFANYVPYMAYQCVTRCVEKTLAKADSFQRMQVQVVMLKLADLAKLRQPLEAGQDLTDYNQRVDLLISSLEAQINSFPKARMPNYPYLSERINARAQQQFTATATTFLEDARHQWLGSAAGVASNDGAISSDGIQAGLFGAGRRSPTPPPPEPSIPAPAARQDDDQAALDLAALAAPGSPLW